MPRFDLEDKLDITAYSTVLGYSARIQVRQYVVSRGSVGAYRYPTTVAILRRKIVLFSPGLRRGTRSLIRRSLAGPLSRHSCVGK